ncbi:hypothetical protein [Hyphomonas sp.]|uniref:hypothetical protein n=1 Tax=Hyphomonas sp. TaxID=87 RepID=UPI0025C47FA0|nr:hypothetical protein [Hyphomonas sp.]
MGVLRAAALLEAGTNVGRVRPAAPPERLSGEAVTVTSLVGVVRVDQTATLLQPARSGAAVFVRTSSGAVLSVEVPSSGETAP